MSRLKTIVWGAANLYEVKGVHRSLPYDWREITYQVARVIRPVFLHWASGMWDRSYIMIYRRREGMLVRFVWNKEHLVCGKSSESLQFEQQSQ